MLLFEKKEYMSEFHIFGQPGTDGNWAAGQARLNTNYRVSYQAFQSLARMHGHPFESFEFIDDESRLALVGFMTLPYGALSDRSHQFKGLSVPEMMIWHTRYKIDVPFSQWIYQMPKQRECREKTNMGILRSYDGGYYLFYIERGRVKHEKLTETCFLQNGIVTPLSVMVERCEAAALKKLESTRTLLAQITDPAEWQMAEKLSNSDLLRFVDSR